jgi:hypothetical protein
MVTRNLRKDHPVWTKFYFMNFDVINVNVKLPITISRFVKRVVFSAIRK